MRSLFIAILILSSSFAVIAEGRDLCVKVPKANLRVGPGNGYAVGWTVDKYFPLKKVGASLSGKWHAVEDIDGDVFWIQQGLVGKGGGCAAVKSARAAVRTGPGGHYRRLFLAEKYHSFKVLKRTGPWIRVQDGKNKTGWVHQSNCLVD